MSVAEDLKDVDVLDAKGKPVALGYLWMDHTVVLAFVRHFGCILCREQVHELNAALASIRRCGAELVIVGCGRPEHVADFCESQKISAPVFVDPEQKAYRAAGLVRSVWSSIKPKAWLNSWRAYRNGARQGPTQGDIYQQGGIFVIRPGNITCYSYVSREAGDHPPVSDVLAAV